MIPGLPGTFSAGDCAQIANKLLAKDQQARFYVAAGSPESVPTINALHMRDWIALFQYPDRVFLYLPGLEYMREQFAKTRKLLRRSAVVNLARIAAAIENPGRLANDEEMQLLFKAWMAGSRIRLVEHAGVQRNTLEDAGDGGDQDVELPAVEGIAAQKVILNFVLN
jgi:hypothetical protein